MLTISSLIFKHSWQTLFHNLQAQVKPGELLEITGANGSGKTTLLRMLAGFLKPSAGDIYYQGVSIHHPESPYRTKVAYLGHKNAIKPALTVQENLIAHSILMGSSFEQLETSLQIFNLQAIKTKMACQLSAGQQRKLAIAKIILAQKPIWLLDEPLTALDRLGIEQFMQQLNQHLNTSGIAIIATHQALKMTGKAIKQLQL